MSGDEDDVAPEAQAAAAPSGDAGRPSTSDSDLIDELDDDPARVAALEQIRETNPGLAALMERQRKLHASSAEDA
ncbi:hypothetical protein OAX78_02960 [Planctomycetota bacterium]|nr:hypothetical protein [Planctomycetota bacterium]